MTQRLTKRGEETVLTETFTYWDNASGAPTSQVKTHRTQSAGYDVTNSYTYDDNGNILSISDGTYTTTYVYDSANQLIRENNQKQNKTTLWVYDAAGNMLGEYTRTYTTADVDISGEDPDYIYDEDGFLTEYNGMTISSDTIGNILKDQACNFYTYKQGRQLATFKEDGNEREDIFRYSYNADGMLTCVANEYTSYDYTYNGTTLTQLVKTDYSGETTLTFTYCAEGTPSTVAYNGTTYYYATNLQGDVTAILDSTGAAVVTYTYDAWGKLLSTDGTMASTLGAVNPLRYRGYTYEPESELYYLQSRFYDPNLRRFISPDAFSSTGQGILGNNMFAYCPNNPVNYSDPTGEVILTALVVGVVAGAVIGGTIGGTAAYNSAKSSGLTGSDLFWATVCGVGKGALIGGVAGGLAGGTVGVIGTYGISAVAGTAMTTTTATIAAKAIEVTALQAKRVQTRPSNGVRIISPALTKAGTSSVTYVVANLMEHRDVPIDFNAFLKTSRSKVLSYGFAAYAWVCAAYSIFCNDPIARANERGYDLR